MPAVIRPIPSNAPQPVCDPVCDHAAALARILDVTRTAWGMQISHGIAHGKGPDDRQSRKERRRAHLAELAGRALDAQMMMLRCRQAFVG